MGFLREELPQLERTQLALPESQKLQCVSLLKITCSLNVMQITMQKEVKGNAESQQKRSERDDLQPKVLFFK